MDIEARRIYKIEDARTFLTDRLDVERTAPLVEDRFANAFIRATKPTIKACCGSDCCA